MILAIFGPAEEAEETSAVPVRANPLDGIWACRVIEDSAQYIFSIERFHITSNLVRRIVDA
jgi:hypothetical protein